MIQNCRLGCAVWSFPRWVGELYPPGTRREHFLREYARVFNAVEGNVSFYGVPPGKNIAAWREATPDGFHLCFKVPREISHARFLAPETDARTGDFLRRVQQAGARMGPVFLLLPPAFGPDRLPRLERFLAKLPQDLAVAVELRHPAMSGDRAVARRVDELLAAHGSDRIIMDSRPVHEGLADVADAVELLANQPKPSLPPDPAAAVGPRPFVRFIGLPQPEDNDPWLAPWVDIAARWIDEGREPYFFFHCPDDFYAPRLARHFHRKLSQLVDVGELPPFARGEQLSLL